MNYLGENKNMHMKKAVGFFSIEQKLSMMLLILQ